MNADRSQLAVSPHDNLQIAIETTGVSGSLAVLRGETVLQQRKLDSQHRAAAALAPALSELMRWCRDTQNRPQLVSIADGPGSFTGLRIGVTTAKTFSYATDLPVIAIDSLASIAAVTLLQEPDLETILVALDAYRGQVFMARFQRAGCWSRWQKSRHKSPLRLPALATGSPRPANGARIRIKSPSSMRAAGSRS